MSKLTDTLRNVWKIEELRERILFTALMLLIVRIGSFISIPGVNVAALKGQAAARTGGLFGLLDMFTGGAYANAAIFALGIMPHISASFNWRLRTKTEKRPSQPRRTMPRRSQGR